MIEDTISFFFYFYAFKICFEKTQLDCVSSVPVDDGSCLKALVDILTKVTIPPKETLGDFYKIFHFSF